MKRIYWWYGCTGGDSIRLALSCQAVAAKNAIGMKTNERWWWWVMRRKEEFKNWRDGDSKGAQTDWLTKVSHCLHLEVVHKRDTQRQQRNGGSVRSCILTTWINPNIQYPRLDGWAGKREQGAGEQTKHSQLNNGEGEFIISIKTITSLSTSS